MGTQVLTRTSSVRRIRYSDYLTHHYSSPALAPIFRTWRQQQRFLFAMNERTTLAASRTGIVLIRLRSTNYLQLFSAYSSVLSVDDAQDIFHRTSSRVIVIRLIASSRRISRLESTFLSTKHVDRFRNLDDRRRWT